MANVQIAGRAALLAELQSVAQRCVQFWQAHNIDLDAYNTSDSAKDIAVLQRALGAKHIRLWAMSYGTHLASAVLRNPDATVESAVLMGYEGPDDTLKLPHTSDQMLEQLARMAANDPKLPTQFRDVIANTERLWAALKTKPLQATVMFTASKPVTLEVGLFEAQLAISAGLGHRETARLLPMAIGMALEGDASVLAELAYAVKSGMGKFSAMPIATDLASGVSVERKARIQQEAHQSRFSDVMNFPLSELAPTFNVSDLGAAFRMPIQSSVPVLFITGGFDARTPPANMDAALPGFASASTLVIEHASHDDDLWLSHPDISNTITRFYAGQWQGHQRLAARPLEFASNIYSELAKQLVAALDWPSLVLLSLLLFGAPIALLYWLLRRRRARQLASKRSN